MRSTIQYIEKELGSEYPRSEINGFIRIILESVCDLSYADQVLYKDKLLDEACRKSIEKIVSRLKKHEPIQYVMGETEFYGLRLKVNPAVLIPRPETEELVNLILAQNIKPDARIIDVGTGSGCIALALKSVLNEAEVYGLDISEKALGTAAENAKFNRLDVTFLLRDILDWKCQTWQTFDVIVSNPPYVRNSEKQMMEQNVLAFEPGNALFVNDDDPLVFYQAIAELAQKYLNKSGWLFFEVNEYLGNEMVQLLKFLKFRGIELIKDINRRDRMIVCRR